MTRIFVTAKTNAKKPSVQSIDANHLKISVKEPPVDGKANKEIIKQLAQHLGVAPSNLQLISGQSARQKIFKLHQKKS